MTRKAVRRMSEAALPIIDVSALRDGNMAARQQVGKKIHEACLDLGFMYVTGHGVDTGLQNQVFEQAIAFFSQPEEAKLGIDMAFSPHNRGYERLGGQTLEEGGAPDLKEGLYIGEEISASDQRLARGGFNLGPNQWPEDLPGFKGVMNAYYSNMMALSERLMMGIALSLDLPETYFADFCKEPITALKLLHYPPPTPSAEPAARGCGAHTDFGAITLLLQDDHGGLQVMSADGRWLHAPPISDTYVVNLADMISRWTNETYRSTLHRVINLSGEERYSIPFFFSGNPAHEVEALECCLAEGEIPKYASTTVEAHMREMYDRTY